jgi:DnaK suppressor protein
MPTNNHNLNPTIDIPENYRPSEQEAFMNPVMLEYFRQQLLSWKADVVKESQATLASLQQESMAEPDITDRASLETERALELRTRDRLRKLISQIDSALDRINDGSFGYCEDTGEPIGIARLEARPIAKYSIEAQERHEKYERTHRENAEDDETAEF